MRTLGLIGGCGAAATGIYYEHINRLVRCARPGHGAPLRLWSFDVEEIDALLRADRWDLAGARFAEAGRWLEAGGAEAVLICTNSMHRIADQVSGALERPLIHLIDVTAHALLAQGCRRPLLIGTRYVMRDGFYQARLAASGIQAMAPAADIHDEIHRIIYEELMAGVASPASRGWLVAIAEACVEADSVVLACTELGLLLDAADLQKPVFDTAALHIAAAVDFILGASAELPAPSLA
jgi:aspartate racemase